MTGSVEHDPGRPRRDHLALIYADTALATRHIGGMPASSTSQASLVAKMLELLDLSEWDARGRPALEDYRISFVPVDADVDLSPGGWQIERRFYRELLTLG